MKKEEILQAILNDGGSYTMATITAVVEQKMMPLKSGCPFKKGEITKKTTYLVGLNGIYANMVNAQREREHKAANFLPKEAWFTRVYDVVNGSIVAKKSDTNCKYVFFACKNAETHTYYVNGKEATAEETAIIKQHRAITDNTGRQDLQNPIVVRTIALDGIESVRANGVKIEIA